MPKKENADFTIYNCHAHSFNLNHVHNRFIKGMVPLSFLLPISFLRKRLLRWVIRRLVNSGNDIIRRLSYFIIHGYNIKAKKVKSQKEIIADLRSYYPRGTRFVIHTMDMDFMINEKAPKNSQYLRQLHDFVKIRESKTNRDIVFPFIHADPRRIEQYPFYLKRMHCYLTKGIFCGIKLYPALGYFPFDKRLKPVYDFALEHNLPITVHCSVGPVYFRGGLRYFKKRDFYKNGHLYHPYTGGKMEGKKPKYFTQHFTHPLNYACLFDPQFISRYWDISIGEAAKYKDLKICLGHYGGSEEWMRYLKFPWFPHRASPLNLKKWQHTVRKSGRWVKLTNIFFPKNPDIRPSWLSIISEMLVKYPNLYADVSFSLSDQEMLPLLKLILTRNEALSKKILFGTDFYMVSMEGAERELSIRLRVALGEELFKTIASDNAKRFLESDFVKQGN